MEAKKTYRVWTGEYSREYAIKIVEDICLNSDMGKDINPGKMSSDQLLGLDHAMSLLAPRHYMALFTRYVKQKDIEGAAEYLNCSKEEIQRNISEALQELQEEWRWNYIRYGYSVWGQRIKSRSLQKMVKQQELLESFFDAGEFQMEMVFTEEYKDVWELLKSHWIHVMYEALLCAADAERMGKNNPKKRKQISSTVKFLRTIGMIDDTFPTETANSYMDRADREYFYLESMEAYLQKKAETLNVMEQKEASGM